MKQSSLAKWLKFIIILVAICGLVFYGGVIPVLGRALVFSNPEFEYCFIPWLVFLCVTAIPCYCALFYAWKIALNIGKDCCFVADNAKCLKKISILAVVNSFFFFGGNIVFFFLGMNHPSVIGASMIFVFLGIAIAVASAVLSYFVNKAAELQEQCDLTV